LNRDGTYCFKECRIMPNPHSSRATHLLVQLGVKQKTWSAASHHDSLYKLQSSGTTHLLVHNLVVKQKARLP